MKEQHRTASAADDLVADYHNWLVSERGLAASMIKYYVDGARQFLGEQDGREAGRPGLQRRQGFHGARVRSTNYGFGQEACDLPAFAAADWHVAGIAHPELAEAVPAPKHWRGSWLPRGLSAE